jgi:hypothetical protein
MGLSERRLGSYARWTLPCPPGDAIEVWHSRIDEKRSERPEVGSDFRSKTRHLLDPLLSHLIFTLSTLLNASCRRFLSKSDSEVDSWTSCGYDKDCPVSGKVPIEPPSAGSKQEVVGHLAARKVRPRVS